MSERQPTMKIGERTVSAAHPCYVIAEIGVNHNGDLGLAHNLIDVAAEGGANAVKFQTFRADALVTRDGPKADYQIRQTCDGSQREMLARLELPVESFWRLRDYTIAKGLDFISTAFDPESLDEVIAFRPKCLKWPSGELNNYPLLRTAASAGLPIILSTGMATFDEVAATIDFLKSTGDPEVAILHCVSNYPAKIEDQNLLCIATMAKAFDRVTGFSDHTLGPWAAIAARPLGMAILEKHITLDRAMDGPDHAASMEPKDFSELVLQLRRVELALGDGSKRPVPSELPVRTAARKSLVYASSLPQGHKLKDTDFLAKRPGNGLAPNCMLQLLGRKLACSVEADQQAGLRDVE